MWTSKLSSLPVARKERCRIPGDAWQLATCIAALVQSVAWADSPNLPLFASGNVVVSEDWEGNFLPDPPGGLPPDGPVPLSLPFARVEHIGSKRDPSTPNRIGEARFRVYVTAGGDGVAGSPDANPAVALNDSHGINAETGLLRNTSVSVLAGQGQSTGKSVNEIMGRIEEALGSEFTYSANGFQGYVQDWGSPIPTDGVQVLTRAFELVVTDATVSRYYTTVAQLIAANAGGGTVNFSWAPLPAGPPFAPTPIVVRRGTNPGDAAPSTPTGGTAVPVLTTTTARATGLSTGHSWNVSVFTAFTETPAAVTAATPDRYSVPVSIPFST